ncbi:g11700 [Coccomyxa elongata]
MSVTMRSTSFCGGRNITAKANYAVQPQNVRASRSQRRRCTIIISALAQRVEYIWADGLEGSPAKGVVFNEMRSKTKVIQKPVTTFEPKDFPDWSFDGSSTGQAEGNNSDCILNPVAVYPDPIRGGDDVLIVCDVLNPDGTPHDTNTRAQLVELLTPDVIAEKPLYGFEQEYTMLTKSGQVFGWPNGGYPSPQGPFYCGVGSESVYGRPLAEAHMDACIKAGLIISGINAEVMPGQWEFQIGPVGPTEVGDQVMCARWLLHRLGENFGIVSTFAPKPVKGDWNGTGAHTNFSTESMRNEGGMKAILAAIERLSKTHAEHISQYGTGNEERLTGKHETCDMNTFRYGVADRGSSIRIPLPVQLKGYGYLEDRRPAANVDPYTVARLLIKSIMK